MATTTVPGRHVHTPTGDCCCPVCEGLECLCRPRFFAGQLLTEVDLNRLDHYIVAKNRIHNRFVHGWGVVCGLEVSCNPCEGYVTVSPGYALSPCGDDIIVCKEATVDLCALVKQCHKKPDPDCVRPPSSTVPNRCKDVEEEWYFAICYNESPSRGVMPLQASDCCSTTCSRCSCGGKCSSKSCGCGCGCNRSKSSSSFRTSSSTVSKSTKSQCEPTVVCEDYTFRIFKKEPEDENKRGALVERFYDCFLKLQSVITPAPNTTNMNVLHQWCCNMKHKLEDIIVANPGCEPDVWNRLANLCPDPANMTPAVYVATVNQRLIQIMTDYFRHCFCSALLPPCPEPACDNCVILATVTVRKSDCTIVKICNLEGRKFLTTFPNLAYWFSWLPWVRDFRDLLIKLCCTPPPPPTPPGTGVPAGTAPQPHLASVNTRPVTSSEMASMAVNSWMNRERFADATTINTELLGLEGPNGRVLTDTELMFPLHTMLLNQIGQPLLENMLPAVFAAQAKAEEKSEVDDLREQIQTLRVMVEKQQKTIDTLKKKK
jgi:hypothetical protein